MKKRILSAIVMLAIVIPVVWIGGDLFRLGVGIVSILALKELLDLKKSHHALPYLVQLVAVITLLFIVLAEYDGYSILFGITYRGIAILLLALLGLSVFYDEKKYTATDALFLIGSVVLLGTAFNAMILARMTDLYLFIYLILIFIFTDTFAMFMGMAFGKHKLIPKVSPKKTVEGSVLGSIIGTVVACVFYHFLISPITVGVVLVTLALSIIGQIGDLIFSKIKRENDIKDFSNLIPGHGGILDRLDSTIAIMLGFLIFYAIL